MLFKIKTGIYHGANYLKKGLFLKRPTKWFLPKPQTIYLIPGYLCNSRCIMCLNWMRKNQKTLTLTQWKKIIDNLESWAGPYTKINIGGGEILLPGYMRQLIDYCRDKFPLTGIVSNGYLIDLKEAKRLIGKEFTNINISIDGFKKETVNLIRGQSFAYEKSRDAVKYLIQEKKRQKSKTKIIVKTVIMGLNIFEIPNMVRWVNSIGADGIYFQPIEPIYASNQTFDELKKTDLWIQEKDKKKALNIINEIIRMKKQNYSILNDLSNLELIKEYFNLLAEVNRGKKLRQQQCEIDTTTLFVWPNGGINFCSEYGQLGNLTSELPGEIINSLETWKQRKIIRYCSKANTCLSTCMVSKNLIQLIKLYLFLR